MANEKENISAAAAAYHDFNHIAVRYSI